MSKYCDDNMMTAERQVCSSDMTLYDTLNRDKLKEKQK